MAVGRLQGRRPARQGGADARERPRASRLVGVQRPRADLLRPLDLQARGNGATRSAGRAPDPHHRERDLPVGGGAGVVVGGAVQARPPGGAEPRVRRMGHRRRRAGGARAHRLEPRLSDARRVRSENVVAKLTGSDPTLAKQVVLFTAHWDHKGIGPAIHGDSIYNGAEDNASGVAALLAAAQALTRVAPRPRRTLLFVATTAEESGLLGSEAYVERPLVPLERTAAVLNLDVANVRGATRDIDALGIDRSTLGAMFQAAATLESLTVVHEPDVRGSFYRSDHFPFARAGVPALSIHPGRDFVGRPAGWGKEQDELYNRERYHQPSDEYRPTFTYAGLAQEVRVTVRLALAIANTPEPPRWLPSSEFQRPTSRLLP